LDPNPLIYGKGLDFLKKNNVKVELAPHYLNKFKDINKIFYHFNKNIRPHITLKLAISKNSFSKNLNETNITSSETQYYMHKYRLTHDAIAVGYNTYIEDKPKLSPRLNGIDKKNFKFVISKINRKLKNFSLIKLNYKDEPYIFLNQLKNYPIKSILIEGGLSTFNYFYNNKLFDEIIICQSKKVIKSSKKRYKLNLGLLKKNLKLYSARSYGEDIIEIYKH
jgi:diaminohydroxyphosphoribosylaminopyrimidine deaminase/5-amino-6-(5-phosphoribosylamino)uracil reductase